jgi:nicotinamide-nucleotide amidase
MIVEVVSIGTELLLGEIVDTNVAYITRHLRDIGANVYFLSTVGDNRERIVHTIRTALSRSDVVITTGGLGPTVDDMTRQAVADALDRELEFRPELLEQIAERFRLFGVPMSDNNRIQAYIPAGAIPVPNRQGTAPCYIVESDQGTVISLPGVPREMKDILAATVLPYLRERMGGVGIIKALVLRAAGIGESHIDAQITDLMTWNNPTVGLAAHSGQTDIRITARADSEEEADRMIAEAEAILRERLGEYIYGTDDDLLEDALMRLLSEKKLKLAVSFTGPEGQSMCQRLHHLEGMESVIAAESYQDDLPGLLARLEYPEEAGDDLSALDFRALSRDEARRLRDTTGADVVIAVVTHHAGTGITSLTAQHERSRRYRFGGSETEAPSWAGAWGMSMAWRLVRQAEKS